MTYEPRREKTCVNTPPLYNVRGSMVYPPFKTLRLSVHPNVHVSVCSSVHQRFVLSLFLEHFDRLYKS